MDDFIWKEIQKKKLRVIKKYKTDLSDPLTNFGKSKTTYSSFGAFYELYLYALVVGLHSNRRVELKNFDTFNLIEEWQPNKKDIFLKLLMTMLSMENIRKESGFDFLSLEMEELDEDELKKRINNLVRIVEEYANGGFEIIHEKYSATPEEFEHYTNLKSFFDTVTQKSCLVN